MIDYTKRPRLRRLGVPLAEDAQPPRQGLESDDPLRSVR